MGTTGKTGTVKPMVKKTIVIVVVFLGWFLWFVVGIY